MKKYFLALRDVLPRPYTWQHSRTSFINELSMHIYLICPNHFYQGVMEGGKGRFLWCWDQAQSPVPAGQAVAPRKHLPVESHLVQCWHVGLWWRFEVALERHHALGQRNSPPPSSRSPLCHHGRCSSLPGPAVLKWKYMRNWLRWFRRQKKSLAKIWVVSW